MPSVHQLDLRLDRFYNYEWGFVNWYVELLNVYGRRKPLSENFNPFQPYSTGRFSPQNPVHNYDNLNSPYIQTVMPGGRLIYLPMVVFGLEVRF